MHRLLPPGAAGLYDPNFEHDACGVGAVADLTGRRTPRHRRRTRSRSSTTSSTAGRAAPRSTPATARASCSSCPTRSCARRPASTCPSRAGTRSACFLPREDDRRREVEAHDRADDRRSAARRCSAGATCRSTTSPGRQRRRGRAPHPPGLRRVHARRPARDELAFERKRLRHPPHHRARGRRGRPRDPELLARTIVYKGMLTSPQLPHYFPELQRRAMTSALALVHSRFSTNTFPSWKLAHPYRMIAHNGEINTCAATSTGCARVSRSSCREAFGDDLEQAAAGRRTSAAATRRRSTTCSSCWCSAAARSRTR